MTREAQGPLSSDNGLRAVPVGTDGPGGSGPARDNAGVPEVPLKRSAALALALLPAALAGGRDPAPPSALVTGRPPSCPPSFEAPAVYALPGMDAARVRANLVYRRVGERELLLDAYAPPGGAVGARPAVVFVHGDAPPDVLACAKDWGLYRSWGRLAAASGFVGITFDRRSSGEAALAEVASDVDAAIAFVRRHARELGVDADRVAVVVFSGGGPFGLRSAVRGAPPHVRAIVAYYAPTAFEGFFAGAGDARLAFRADLGRAAPMLLVKAGRDRPDINASLDALARDARAAGASVTVLTHPSGPHGFDALDDSDTSRAIVARTLAFLRGHLR